MDNANRPVVSVIVPCFNRSDYLQACLTSIAQQTYPAIEVIVVDDASEENLKCVIDKIEWPDTFTTRYIRLDENRGQGYAREIGRQQATGNFINYQDSDDLFHPDKIVTQVEMLENNPQAGMCYCITLTFFNYPFDGSERLRNSHYVENFLPDILEKRPWSTGSCLWTRAATDAIGPWFDGRREEDFLYEVRAGCRDIGVAYVPQILMYVRNHLGEAELRAPSKHVYQQAITAYHEMLRELATADKLNNPRALLAVTREIVRVCRKLYDFEDVETANNILQHLTTVGRPHTRINQFYFFVARLILVASHIMPQKYQARIFSRLCQYVRML